MNIHNEEDRGSSCTNTNSNTICNSALNVQASTLSSSASWISEVCQDETLLKTLNIDQNRRGIRGICAADPITKSGMRTQHCQMLSISILPISIVMAFTTYMFVMNLAISAELNEINHNIYVAIDMFSLMNVLQRERDTSALYCSAIGPDTKGFLIRNYASTDAVLESMTVWPVFELSDEVQSRMGTKGKFITYLNRHRYELDVQKPVSEVELEFYGDIIQDFIKALYRIITAQKQGILWKILVCMVELVKSSESFGIERALGTVFFIRGGFFERDSYLWFLKSQDQGNHTLKMAIEYSTEVSNIYQEVRQEETALASFVRDMRYLIRESKVKVNNNSFNLNPSAEEATWWFDNMTIYLDTIHVMQTRLAELAVSKLTQNDEDIKKILAAMCTIFVLVIFVTPLMLYSIYKLTQSIQRFSLTLVTRTITLNDEKKRTNQLLYQMLPKSVAEQLKNNKTVEPVLFESATVCFCDLVDFTAISAKSSPVQVIDMLDLFFTTLDVAVARYDVFKVETIGDAYVAVSGVPKKNGKRHAAELGSLSLHITNQLRSLQIPHMPGILFHVRIGCHTGPVITGVVGFKMPRYCLFGETVTLAAKMESTGKPDCIHISDSTNDLLKKDGSFITVERTDVQTEEKTYWLLHKKGMVHGHRKHSTGSAASPDFAEQLFQGMIEQYSSEELDLTGESSQDDTTTNDTGAKQSLPNAESHTLTPELKSFVESTMVFNYPSFI